MSRMFHKDWSQPVGQDWIFVFGSNLAGRHGRGAARAAAERFDAEYGVGAGITGRAYALPTKDRAIKSLGLEDIGRGVRDFLEYAKSHPDKKFFVTRVGCELAGYSDSQIAPLFVGAPTNCSFAEAWRPWIEPRETPAYL